MLRSPSRRKPRFEFGKLIGGDGYAGFAAPTLDPESLAVSRDRNEANRTEIRTKIREGTINLEMDDVC